MRKEGFIVYVFALLIFVLSFVSAIPVEELSVNSTTLSKQIIVSQQISNLFNIFFNLESTTALDLQSAVFLAVLFLCVFFVVHSVVGFIPFFEGNIKSLVVALAITLISSMGGGMNYAYTYLASLGKQFSFISNSNSLSLFISLALVIFFSIIFIYVMHGIKKIISRQKSNEDGFKIGKTISENKMYSTIFRDSIKDSEYDK